MLRKVLLLLLNVALMVAFGAGVLWGFFYGVLPSMTEHGETLTVPDLSGMPVAEAAQFLEERDLSYEVTDSAHRPKENPYAVIKQYPLPDSKVKRGRSIQLTINNPNAPFVTIRLADVYGKGEDYARLYFATNRKLVLPSAGLLEYTLMPPELGQIETQSSLVYKMQFIDDDGQTVTVGEADKDREFRIRQGSEVQLTLGYNAGARVQLSNVVGLPLPEAETLVVGTDLNLRLLYDPNSTQPAGTILRQTPAYAKGLTVRTGSIVTVEVAGDQDAVQEALLDLVGTADSLRASPADSTLAPANGGQQ